MKQAQIRSAADIAPAVIARDGNEFRVKQTADEGMLAHSGMSIVEVAPGNYAYGYHWHETTEEIFYIVQGHGVVRLPDGDHPVKAGDTITMPTGEGGAHVMRNDSQTETLVYLDFGARGDCDIVHLPDARKIMYAGPYTKGMCDEA